MWYVIIALFLLGIYVFQVEPRWFRERHEEVELGKTATILLLTDIHVGWGRVGRKELLQACAKRAGDVGAILIGGDPIDAQAKYYPVLEAWLRELVALGKPVYAVYGDHDHHHGQCSLEQIAGVYQRSGVTLLDNETVKIGEVTLLGMRDLCLDAHYRTERLRGPAYAKQAAQKLGGALPPCDVALVHNPDGLYHSALSERALVLAGHTHGGQYVPLRWFGLPIPPGSFRSWAGRQRVAGYELIVSRGCGSSSFPGRFLVRPELVVVRMR